MRPVVGRVEDDGVVGDAKVVEQRQQLADMHVVLDYAVGEAVDHPAGTEALTERGIRGIVLMLRLLSLPSPRAGRAWGDHRHLSSLRPDRRDPPVASASESEATGRNRPWDDGTRELLRASSGRAPRCFRRGRVVLRLLLDTCTFLWLAADGDQLSAMARQACREPSNEVFFSALSAWEIAIKYRLG